MQANLGKFCTDVERGFNVAGALPVVSVFSGVARMVIGKVQAVAGAILAAIGAIAFALTSNNKWDKVLDMGVEFIVQGALNFSRGTCEMVMGTVSFGVLNLCFLFLPNYALARKRDPIAFAPIVHYGSISQDLRPYRFA